MLFRISLSGLALATIGLGWPSSAHAQYVQAPAVRYYYPQARPQAYAYTRGYRGVSPRREVYRTPALPYNKSPYTDDWSTGRHLPFPKPWMLPTRDPAYRGGR